MLLLLLLLREIETQCPRVLGRLVRACVVVTCDNRSVNRLFTMITFAYDSFSFLKWLKALKAQRANKQPESMQIDLLLSCSGRRRLQRRFDHSL